jgi:hypothetical protein
MTPSAQTRAEGRRFGLERALAELATRQHGVVGLEQLRGLGFSPDAVKVRCAEGRLRALHREVFAVGHSQISRRGEWWAAVLAYGPGTVLSHRSAAALWGIRRERSGPIDVNAPRGRQGLERRSGIWVHRCRLPEEEATTHGGLPVATVARTLFDLAESTPFRELFGCAEEADRLKILRLGELERACELGHGRRALRPTRRLLAELGAPKEGRSPLENRFQEFCERQHLPAPARNVEVLGHEVDALWPDAKLVAELDSWEHHGHRSAFERDRARDPELLLAGYRTIRVTHRRLDREAPRLARQIRALLKVEPRL